MKSRTWSGVAFLASLALLIGLIGLIQHFRVSTPENVIEGTTANFEDTVVKSPEPVYVFFYVGGGKCKACDAEQPIFAKLATEYKGKVRFVRVDASKEPAIAQAAGLTRVPAHIFLKPAEQIGTGGAGFLDEPTMRQFIEDGIKMQKPADPATPADGTNPPAQADPAKKDGK